MPLDPHEDLLNSDSSDRRAARIRLARLESDLAYFQTRLELIGKINSSHRLAQRKVFNQLIKATAREILAVKGRQPETYSLDTETGSQK